MEIPIRELDAATFATFGAVVEAPMQPCDAAGPGWSWWAGQAALPAIDRAYGVGYLRLDPCPPRFDWAEQHRHSVEMIIPVSGDCLVYVAAPDAVKEPDGSLDLSRFCAFRLRAGQAVILKEGVWHGAPLAIDGSLSALVLLAEGTGRTDTRLVRFVDTPVTIVR